MLTTSQERRRAGTDHVQISTPTADILPTPSDKLLGAWDHQDLKWSEHLQDNQESLMRSLSTRLAALKKLGKVASLRT